MHAGALVLAQLMEFLPRHEFHSCVRRYGGDRRSRRLLVARSVFVFSDIPPNLDYGWSQQRYFQRERARNNFPNSHVVGQVFNLPGRKYIFELSTDTQRPRELAGRLKTCSTISGSYCDLVPGRLR